MDLTYAQKKGLREVYRNVLLKQNMKGRGHMYDHRGVQKLVDARVVNSLLDKNLIKWDYDWGYDDHCLVVTDKGKRVLREKELIKDQCYDYLYLSCCGSSGL